MFDFFFFIFFTSSAYRMLLVSIFVPYITKAAPYGTALLSVSYWDFVFYAKGNSSSIESGMFMKPSGDAGLDVWFPPFEFFESANSASSTIILVP